MRNIRSKQKGLTLGGLIVVLGFIAALVTFAVRAFPLYNEKMQIVSAVNTVVSDPEAAGKTDHELRSLFLRNINATTNIDRFNDRNIKEHVIIEKPRNPGEPKILHLKYESIGPFVHELQLLMVVDMEFPVRGNEGGE